MFAEGRKFDLEPEKVHNNLANPKQHCRKHNNRPTRRRKVAVNHPNPYHTTAELNISSSPIKGKTGEMLKNKQHNPPSMQEVKKSS